jgi:16S rRNA (adenine1518-N6/adenine1519-N6)-dimethyltransferase
MNLLEETKFLLRKHRIFPKKSLGQHFMVEPLIFQLLAERASLTSSDFVLDIGAGFGFLTRFLAERCRKVLAVEIDSRLVKILQDRLKDLPNVKVIKGDVLKLHIPKFNKIVSIPPYKISSALLKWFFNKDFSCAVLVLQKEFANRLMAPVESADYGWLSVLSYYHFECELFDDVPKRMFYPQPEVDSIIVRLTPRSSPPFHVKNYALFMKLVQTLFIQRNRKVRNALQPFTKKRYTALEDTVKVADSLPFHDRRVRELAPEDFGELANVLFG